MPAPDPSRGTAEPDDDLDLPPLDGGAGDESEHEAFELDAVGEDGALDDSVLGDDAFAVLEGDTSENATLDGAEPAADLEVGGLDAFAEEDGPIAGADAPGLPEEDLDVVEETLAADGGEEGPEADDEAPDPGALPRLDDDGEGEDDDDRFFDGQSIGREELPRAERPLDPWFAADLSRAPSILVAAEGSAFALSAPASDLLSIREDGTQVLVRDARAVAYEDGALYTMTRAGLLVSRDGGRSFEGIAAWREGALLVAEGRPWLHSPRGELFVLGENDRQWHAARTRVVACSPTPGGKLAFLAQGDSSLWLSARGRTAPVPDITGVVGLLVSPDPDGPVLAHTATGIHVLRGDAWARVSHSADATARAFVPGPEGGILFARSLGSTSVLVRVAAPDGSGEGDIVAELPGDARVTALASMGAIVWAGGDFGVVALRVPGAP